MQHARNKRGWLNGAGTEVAPVKIPVKGFLECGMTRWDLLSDAVRLTRGDGFFFAFKKRRGTLYSLTNKRVRSILAVLQKGAKNGEIDLPDKKFFRHCSVMKVTTAEKTVYLIQFHHSNTFVGTPDDDVLEMCTSEVLEGDLEHAIGGSDAAVYRGDAYDCNKTIKTPKWISPALWAAGRRLVRCAKENLDPEIDALLNCNQSREEDRI